jgi:hypothetical protein
MGLAAAYSVIDEFKIKHANIHNEESYEDRLVNIEKRKLKWKIFFQKTKQIFNQTMSTK